MLRSIKRGLTVDDPMRWRTERQENMSKNSPRGQGGPAGMVAAASILWLVMLAPLAAYAAPYAAVVMDARSGEILHARNHDTRLHPASLTKMMTLYIAFEAVKNGEIGLDTPVTVSRNAASEVCSCLGLRAGQRIALRYLIRAAAVRSGNDAATAIAEAISGSEAAFAARMNRTARAIGMNDTTFRNAHGLTHPEHLSTARDMTTLGRQLFYDYPQYYNLFSRRSTHAGIADVVNTNRRFLAAYSGADGIKTGYTRAAGFNLVGSAERGGKRIIATIFGGNSVAHRNARMAELLDMGFARAPTHVAVRKPPPPSYDGSTNGTARAGRIVRADTAVKVSLRPRLRAGPEDAEISDDIIAAIQSNVDSAIAASQAEDAAVEPDGDLAEVMPEPRPAADQQADAAPPEQSAQVAQAVEDVIRESEVQVEVATATADTPAPEASPFSQDTAKGDTVAETGSDADRTSDSAAASEGTAEPTPTRPAIPAHEDESAPSAIVLTSSAQPRARPQDTVLAALQDDHASLTSGAPEVITRSRVGDEARDWSINVGRFPNRFEADRALLQIAMAEISILEAATRRVDRGATGFDATFTGLSRDDADRACRRLQARDRTCFTVAP